MPLGNSITQSDAANYSYRYNLWKKLLDANLEVDFVGSHAVNRNGNPEWPTYKGKSFDPDNEGHWGWSTDQVLYGNTQEPAKGKLSQWLTGYTPDIVLMHLGTNDMFRNHPVDETLNELREVVRQIRGKNSTVTILMAKLIPAYDQKVGIQSANNIKLLNEQIPALVRELNNATSPVILVDQNTGFDATTGVDTWDGIHPNASGEEKMAERWFDAIMGTITPLSVALISLEAQFVRQKGVQLSWKTASEEKNAYFEVQRATDPASFTSIGIVKGAGTTQLQSDYTYLDSSAPAGDAYYRLKQVNIDGSSMLSRVMHVHIPQTAARLQVYPTAPANRSITIDLTGQQPHAEVEIFIYTMEGKRVGHVVKQCAADGKLTAGIQLNKGQQAGTYLVQVITKAEKLEEQFILR